MQDRAPSGDEAAQWLREQRPVPHIDISWRNERPVAEANRRRILEILFSPSADTPSA